MTTALNKEVLPVRKDEADLWALKIVAVGFMIMDVVGRFSGWWS